MSCLLACLLRKISKVHQFEECDIMDASTCEMYFNVDYLKQLNQHIVWLNFVTNILALYVYGKTIINKTILQMNK